MKLADLYLYLQSDIQKIEKELERSVQADHPVLRDASVNLLKAGGKRIRPVFVLLAAQFGDYDIHRIKHIAVPLELIHMASLVHDDVIDDSKLRRGRETIKSKYDNRVAMYTGDYIFAKAVEQTAYFDDPDIHFVISHAIMEMCIGEIEQIRDQYSWNQNLRMYLRRIKRKTALLIAVSCQLGAMAAGASKHEQRLLYDFGYNVGMAFQITDDILDFIGTEEELGKPAGGDLLQGNVTIPALYAMHEKPDIFTQIHETFADDVPDHDQLGQLLAAVNESGGIPFAKSLSDRYLNRAYHALEKLPESEARMSLTNIARYIGKRNH
ncbi:heptaprenyl diphosphate synthase component II [Salsuginibacillus kocurii]|uniref:heptaprenyl diphosphate synthase component II n=1 Tax=Salsuginibacillus kocurii TaxID=427078 RepID=UPI0003792268|nr:heptaprenyl diphosphate synthase component II [Salsuginibacillus kocurii]